jgi:molybdopterin synthase catalytic subunit
MGAVESSEAEAAAAAATSTSATSTSATARDIPKKFEGEQSRQDADNVYVSLTYEPLDATKQMSRVKSAKAGAVLLFAGQSLFCSSSPLYSPLLSPPLLSSPPLPSSPLLPSPHTAQLTITGCTRDSFASKAVTHLSYSTYAPLALNTLSRIACHIKQKHHLTAIAITHRLGHVDIGDESILIAVSSPHRQAAWRAGEACLEDVKKSAEIWKEEWFEDGGVWRSNRDGQAGVPVRKASVKSQSQNPSGTESSTTPSAAAESGSVAAPERRASHASRDKGKERERKVSVSAPKDTLPPTTSRRKSSVQGTSITIGIKKAATEPLRPKVVARTTTFYEGGFEI